MKRANRRGFFARVFLPDPGVDGVMSAPEWLRFFFGRSLLVASMGLCMWTAANDLLGPTFQGLFGPLGLIVGILVGCVVGAVAPFMEAFGIWLTARQREFGAKAQLFTLFLVSVFITIGLQLYLGSHLIASDRERLEAAERQDAVIVERANEMRDTDTEREELDAANESVRRAEAHVARVEGWLDSVIACAASGGGPCDDVRAIQVALGLRDDGMVRGNVAGCDNCGETTNRVNAELTTARASLSAAEARQASASVALRAAERLIACVDEAGAVTTSGACAASVELEADNAQAISSVAKGFRQLAVLSFKAAGDERQHDEAAVEQRSQNVADLVVIVLVLFINASNMLLNNTAHGSARREEDDEGPGGLIVDQSGEPFDPGPQPAMASGEPIGPAPAFGHYHERESRPAIPLTAPRQSWETASDWAARKAEALRVLREQVRVEEEDEEAAALAEEAAELDAREARMLQRKRLEQRRAKLDKLESDTRAKDALLDDPKPKPVETPAGGNGGDSSANTAEKTVSTVSTVSTAGPATAAPVELAPGGDIDISVRSAGLSDGDLESEIRRLEALRSAAATRSLKADAAAKSAAKRAQAQADIDQFEAAKAAEQKLIADVDRQLAHLLNRRSRPVEVNRRDISVKPNGRS